jgi:hypothetical protein
LGAENHAFAIDVRKKGGGAAFLGVSKYVVSWHIRKVEIREFLLFFLLLRLSHFLFFSPFLFSGNVKSP